MNIIAEIGINHNGSIDIAKKLIRIAKKAGCNYVKIQKRNPDICVPENQKNIPKSTPWGDMTYLEYKKKIEFNEDQIKDLASYAENLSITFFASVWDHDSVDLMAKYTRIGKIPSALITDLELCKYAREKFDFLIISTGMSTEEEIERAINSSSPNVVMHTNSTYPSKISELNLNYITHLKTKYPNIQIGYSGHETEIITTICTVVLGVEWIERHITLDKDMWGSDQKCSLNKIELRTLIKGIRMVKESCFYSPGPRILFESEKEKRESLRKD